MVKKSISLRCTVGTSDKVYHIQIVDGTQPNRFTVAFQYGRTGGKLTWGNRDGSWKKEDVSLWEAERYFDSKVSEQKKKGYHVIPDPEGLMTLIGFSF